ncbi:hypothetical protein Tco_1370287 [Tanacetum coccineum]
MAEMGRHFAFRVKSSILYPVTSKRDESNYRSYTAGISPLICWVKGLSKITGVYSTKWTTLKSMRLEQIDHEALANLRLSQSTPDYEYKDVNIGRPRKIYIIQWLLRNSILSVSIAIMRGN